MHARCRSGCLLRLVGLVLVGAGLGGCAGARELPSEASPDYYVPAGWHDAARDLETKSHADFSRAVSERVRRHRRVLDTVAPDAEIAAVAPTEHGPGVSTTSSAGAAERALMGAATDTAAGCDADAPRGIAVLVHGLSDTAFAMGDLARAFAARCFVARTLLLPGHGTVPGDLLAVDLEDWTAHVRHAARLAARESDTVVLVGFSLGAVLALSQILEDEPPIAALVSVSPAFRLSSWRLARFAPWAKHFRPWIDRGWPDDRFRYEAMPTHAVGELVRAVRRLDTELEKRESGVTIPWLLVQSLDDAVTLPVANLSFFARHARDPASRAIVFASALSEPLPDALYGERLLLLPGDDAATRVRGLTHVAVHVAPDNPHYGAGGAYRNCGATAGRERSEVAACESAAPGTLDYGLWNSADRDGVPSARSTFNPHFAQLEKALGEFLEALR